MSDAWPTSSRERLRALYVKQAEERFDKAFPKSSDVIERLVQALDDPKQPIRAEDEHIVIQLGGGGPADTKKWRLAGFNHEYVTQLAYLVDLGDLVAEATGEPVHEAVPSLVRAEHRDADLVVFDPSVGDGFEQVLIQIEVKTDVAASRKEAQEALEKPQAPRPVRARLAQIQPTVVVFVHADSTRDVFIGRPVAGVLTETFERPWSDVRADLLELLRKRLSARR